MNYDNIFHKRSLMIVFIAWASSKTLNAQPCLFLIFSSQAQIDAFPATYPGCTQIPYWVIIKEDAPGNITNLDSLSTITYIGEDLDVNNNAALNNFKGLNNLKTIAGNFKVNNNATLSNFSGLNNLTSIAGNLDVHENAALINFDGLENLASIGGAFLGGSFLVNENASITNFSGLDNLDSIQYDLL